MKKNKGPNLEKYLNERGHHFVNYAQGAKIYKLPYWSFVRVAKEAGSNYPIRKTCIVDLNILDKYLEEHPETVERLETIRRKNNGKQEKKHSRT